jgi:hypothetical protein
MQRADLPRSSPSPASASRPEGPGRGVDGAGIARMSRLVSRCELLTHPREQRLSPTKPMRPSPERLLRNCSDHRLNGHVGRISGGEPPRFQRPLPPQSDQSNGRRRSFEFFATRRQLIRSREEQEEGTGGGPFGLGQGGRLMRPRSSLRPSRWDSGTRRSG